MKVGILTFHRALNYGAVLQALGLVKTVEKLGKEATIIDYRCKTIEDDYKNIKIEKGSVIKDIVNSMLSYSTRKRKKNSFRMFCNNNLNLSSKAYYSKEDLLKLNEECSTFITGSDQVWDDKCANFDEAFFLTFVNDSSKKNSYAASFAFGELPKGLECEYKNRLEDFNSISVREEKGKDIFSTLLNKNIHIDLDPTLLLDKEEWMSYTEKSTESEKYILIYTVNQPRELFSYAEELSKNTGYKLIYINDSLKKKVNAEYRRGVSPSEFLTLFANAEYVLTNSFHGTAFSIIYEKKFIVEINSKKNKINYRSKNLLSMLNLENRILDGTNNIRDNINYVDVKNKLNNEKKLSIEYLSSIVR